MEHMHVTHTPKKVSLQVKRVKFTLIFCTNFNNNVGKDCYMQDRVTASKLLWSVTVT
jgi:hypothetical protein